MKKRDLLMPVATILLSPCWASAETPPQLEDKIEVNTLLCEDSSSEPRTNNLCQVGDWVVVDTTNLDQWIDQAAGRVPEKLLLVLNGHVLKGNYGVRVSDKKLSFRLKPNPAVEENVAAWRMLLTRSKLVRPRPMTLALSLEDSTKLFGRNEINLVVTSSSLLWVVGVVFLILLVVFVVLARKSDIIRDPGPLPASGRRPFSLARTQMAWWFFLVVGAFLYLWMVMVELDTLTTGVLGLIGISSATGFASVVVDSSKTKQLDTKRGLLGQELASLESRIENLTDIVTQTPPPTNLAELIAERINKEARFAEVQKELSELPKAEALKSENFLLDILREHQGVAFHRFQIFAWTIVLGIVFVRAVYTELSMPEFDATLLSLMGISSGTYLGFKFPGAVTT